MNARRKFVVLLVLVAVLPVVLSVLVACDQQAQVSSASTGLMPARQNDSAVLALGQAVFQQHCSGCHGAQAQGDPNWRKRKPDGKYPPPPLNGSGHAWHHSRAMLHEMIRTGSRPGEGDMPAWQGKLTGDEIDAAISWFQSLWPDQVYAAWYEMQERGNE